MAVAELLVFALQRLPLYVQIQRLLDVLLVLYIERNGVKWLLALRVVRLLILERYDFVRKVAADELLQQGFLGGRLQVDFELIAQ